MIYKSLASILLLVSSLSILGVGAQQKVVDLGSKRSIIYTKTIQVDDKIIGDLDIFDGSEPVDIIHDFFLQHESKLQDLKAGGNFPAGASSSSSSAFNDDLKALILRDVCAKVSCTRDKALLYRTTAVTEEKGEFVAKFEFFEGTEIEPVDMVYNFVTQYGLDMAYKNVILKDLCRVTTCTRTQALLYRLPIVNRNGEFIDNFEYFEDDQEPADVANVLIAKHGLNVEARNAILSNACNFIPCRRVLPAIWKKPVSIDGSPSFELVVLEGEEPADAVYKTLGPHVGVNFYQRQQIIQAVKNDGVPSTRDFALLYSTPVVLDREPVGTIQFYDDMQEPVDVLYNFLVLHKLDLLFDKLNQDVLAGDGKLCSNNLMVCNRLVPVTMRQTFTDTAGNTIGTVEILKDQEPVDAVDEFLQFNRLDQKYRDNMLQVICREPSITCTRSTPIVYKKPVVNENGEFLGELNILEGEEVFDVVLRFLQALVNKGNNLNADKLMGYFLQDACKSNRVMCTRKY